MLNCTKFEDSKHRNIYVDVTHDCNLNCNFCYDKPQRGKGSEISLEYFEDVCRRLAKSSPRKKWIRLLGGEPTIDDRILDFIRIAKEHGHLVSIPTNGIKIGQDLDFCKELKKLAPLYVHMSLDGGLDHGAYYTAINGYDVGPIKRQALENLKAVNFKHVHIGALIVRNLNEKVVPEIITIARRYDNIRGVHFRSGGNIGLYPENNVPLSLFELKTLVKPYVDRSKSKYEIDGQNGPLGENCCGGCIICTAHIPKPIKLVLIEFGSKNTMNCWFRARLSPDNKLLPFFQTMKKENNR